MAAEIVASLLLDHPVKTLFDWTLGNGFDGGAGTLKGIVNKDKANKYIEQLLNFEKMRHDMNEEDAEFNFDAVQKYIKRHLWTDFVEVYTGKSEKECQDNRDEIIRKAILEAGESETKEISAPAKRTVERMVAQSLGVLLVYFDNQLPETERYLANRVTKEVNEKTEEIVNRAEKRIISRMCELLEQMKKNNSETEVLEGKDPNKKFWKTRVFKETWKKPMFLEEKLSLADFYGSLDAFLMPDYEIEKRNGEKEDRVDLHEKLSSLGKDGLVIFGPPGIGKSTLMVWLCNKYSEEQVYAYSLADIFNENRGETYTGGKEDLDFILIRTGLKKENLEGKILLLDGLDEIARNVEDLGSYITQVISDCRNRNIIPIVTCRTNYISNIDKLKDARIEFITLKPWNGEKICEFIKRYPLNESNHITDDIKKYLASNSDLYGIPLLLYMVLALDIAVGKENDETDIYDKIFDKNGGGIFGRRIKVENGGTVSYEHIVDADLDKVKETLRKSREIAFQMFETGIQEADDPFSDLTPGYKEIFKRFTEGEKKVQFIHRSMYEYFAVDYLITQLDELLPMDGTIKLGNPEPLAETLAFYCKRGRIEDNESSENPSLIASFMKSKLRKLFDAHKFFAVDGGIKKELYFWWEEGIYEVFQKGVIPCAYKKEGVSLCTNSLKEEMNCCKNMIDLLKSVYKMYCQEKVYDEEIRIFRYSREKESKRENDRFSRYLKTVSCEGYRIVIPGSYLKSADLSYAKLSSAKLSYANLRSADLSYADLSYANLRSADLRSADLSSAKLSSAKLSYAKLSYAKLSSADLHSANLSSADLSSAKLSSAKLSSADLRSADLSSADLSYADLRYAYLSSADLHSAKLSSADLSSADLSSAKLRSANLRSADLSSAKLSYADLSYADLRSADLRSAKLVNSDMDEAKLLTQYKTRENIWETRTGKSFPIHSIGYAKFDTIYVDGTKYSRKEFFEAFPENEDHL